MTRTAPSESGKPGYMGGKEAGRTERKLATLEKVGFGMIALAIAELFGIVFVNLIALVPAFVLSMELSNPSYELSLFVPIEIPLFTIEGSWFLLYFVIIIMAIVGSFVWLMRKEGRQWLQIVRHPYENSEELANTATNSFTLIGQLFFALLFFNLLYILGVWVAGSVATAPNLEGGNFRSLLFLLANAAVYEEIVVRVLLLGLPLLIVKGWQQRKLTRGTLKKYLWGGGIELGKVELTVVGLSSVIFGLAHVVSGWGWWKFGQATLGGVILGYLFLRVGLHSSIALHFVIDYLSVFLLLIETFNLLNVPSTALLLGIGMIATIVLWLVASTYYFAMYVHRILRALWKAGFSKDTPTS